MVMPDWNVLPHSMRNERVRKYYDVLCKKRRSLIVKRAFDIVTSLMLLILLMTAFICIAILIKRDSDGPVIFSQTRVTSFDRNFTIYKFRSMVERAPELGSEVTVANDMRITKIGAVLRKYRLDELPQFFDILIGNMSVVGPRPERVEHVEKYVEEVPEFTYRMKVKGGLTGYAQIYGKYNTSAYDKLKLDLMYIQNYSILLDLRLILMTVKIMFIKDSTEGFEEIKPSEKKD